MMTGVQLLLLAAAFCAAVAAAQTVQLDQLDFPLVQFSFGQRLEDLPGRSVLVPDSPRTSINITLTPATLVASNGTDTLAFTNGMYRDGDTGEVHLFGPTLRLRAGDTYTIYLANNLSIGSNTTQGIFNEFRDPADTNLHTHGLHDSPGVLSQDTAEHYYGEDNIFIVVPGKLSDDAEPARLVLNSSIPPDHLPGLHWYHPHMHGSSTLQTSTANGLIIVEDDASWLPAENGCTEVWSLMQEVPDVLLHVALLTFAGPSAMTLSLASSVAAAERHDTNYQVYSKFAAPRNIYCCNETGTDYRSLPLLGTLSDKNLALVNGAYAPVISLQAGRYQRWRLVNTGYKGMVDLTVLDPATGLPTDQCDLQLLAKDGVYLMQIPRTVDHIFLASGNRAELLVRCQGAPGDVYIIAAGATPSPFGPGFANTTEAVYIDQPIVATIEVTAAEGATHTTPQQKACTPLRPGYAPDLRDAALEAHGALPYFINETHGFYFDDRDGCNVDNEAFSFPDPEPLLLPMGHVVHWHFENIGSHPVHLHVNPFQIVEMPQDRLMENLTYTSWFEEGDYMDTVMVPSLDPDQTNKAYLGLRIQPGQFAGYAVLHCHLLQHEDRGCMKVVRYECPGFNETQPELCRDYSYPVPGTYRKYDPTQTPEYLTQSPALAPLAAPIDAVRSGGSQRDTTLLTQVANAVAGCMLIVLLL